MSIYVNKYLKYKKKYLNLINQMGGGKYDVKLDDGKTYELWTSDLKGKKNCGKMKYTKKQIDEEDGSFTKHHENIIKMAINNAYEYSDTDGVGGKTRHYRRFIDTFTSFTAPALSNDEASFLSKLHIYKQYEKGFPENFGIILVAEKGALKLKKGGDIILYQYIVNEVCLSGYTIDDFNLYIKTLPIDEAITEIKASDIVGGDAMEEKVEEFFPHDITGIIAKQADPMDNDLIHKIIDARRGLYNVIDNKYNAPIRSATHTKFFGLYTLDAVKKTHTFQVLVPKDVDVSEIKMRLKKFKKIEYKDNDFVQIKYSDIPSNLDPNILVKIPYKHVKNDENIIVHEYKYIPGFSYTIPRKQIKKS